MAPRKYKHGLTRLRDRLPGPPPSSALPPAFEPVKDKYYMDKYAIPTEMPLMTPVKPSYEVVGNKLQQVTPPPSHQKIEEVPGKLEIKSTWQGRSVGIPGGDLLRKRKTKPRVYEYEPGAGGRFIESIEDTEKRQAVLRAFIRATYPAPDNWVKKQDDDGSYDETLGPNQDTGLRQPRVGDFGIPDTETLMQILAFRAEYNPWDNNTTVRPKDSTAPMNRKRRFDEYDLDASGWSSSDEDENPPPSPPQLEETAVKRIKLIKRTQPATPEPVAPAPAPAPVPVSTALDPVASPVSDAPAPTQAPAPAAPAIVDNAPSAPAEVTKETEEPKKRRARKTAPRAAATEAAATRVTTTRATAAATNTTRKATRKATRGGRKNKTNKKRDGDGEFASGTGKGRVKGKKGKQAEKPEKTEKRVTRSMRARRA